MDDIGGIIFYIIAAIIGIITTVGKNKKKREAAGKPPPVISETIDKEVFGEDFDRPVRREVFSPETILEEIFSEKPEPVVPGYSFEPQEPVKQVFDPVMEGDYQEPMAGEFINEGESVTEMMAETDIEEVTDEIAAFALDQQVETEEEFDLRKAVIYSEILNRKYY